MEIKNIDLRTMRNAEQFQFHTEFLNTTERFGLIQSKLTSGFWNEYKSLYNLVDEALKKIFKSDFTHLMNEVDKKRDKLFAGIYLIIKGHLNTWDQGNLESARKLKIIFDTYGNLSKKPRDEQSSSIYNLIQDLRTPENHGHVASLNLVTWVNTLDGRNKEYIRLKDERYSEESRRTDVNLFEARIAADEKYYEAVKLVNAFALTDNDEANVPVYKEYISLMNAIVDNYKIKLIEKKIQ